MTTTKRCPKCNSTQTYVRVGGSIQCRSCGYDSRKVKQSEQSNEVVNHD